MRTEPREWPAKQSRQRSHAQRRAQAEQRHVAETRRGRGQCGQHERGQRATARKPVNRADDEGATSERPCADVHMRRHPRVAVHCKGVAMRVGGFALPNRLHHGTRAERDQHGRDEQFEDVCHTGREFGTKHDKDRTDDHEPCGVPQTPAGAEQCRLETVAFAADQRGHRREMIGLESVAHAEQRSEARAGKEFENWHNAERGPSYVNILLIAIGGAVGSVCRYLLSSAVLRGLGTLFPAGTFVVNVVGCLVFGAITGAAQARITLSPEARALLLAGLLGGFTTFSSYMNESVVLVREGHFLWAAMNLGGQVVVGFVAFSIAYAMASFR